MSTAAVICMKRDQPSHTRVSNSCNKHLLGLGQVIKTSICESEMIGYQFGTVGVSDGISNGTAAMNYSLQSRDLIADQVETAAGGHWLDAMVVVPGCDKNMPGVLMARRCFVGGAPFLCLIAHSRKAQPAWFDGLRRLHPRRFMRGTAPA